VSSVTGSLSLSNDAEAAMARNKANLANMESRRKSGKVSDSRVDRAPHGRARRTSPVRLQL
jgi:hypothetical protein